MTAMRAAVVAQPGAAPAPAAWPEPKPGASQAVVRVRAAALNQVGADEITTLGAISGRYDLMVDPPWGRPAAAALGLLAPGGPLLNVGQAAAATTELDGGTLRHTGARINGFSGTRLTPGVVASAYRDIAAHLAAGRVQVGRSRFPPTDIGRAWNEQAGSPGRGLVVLP